jgi:hypothetical protein
MLFNCPSEAGYMRFFAKTITRVKAGDELAWDYGMEFWRGRWKELLYFHQDTGELIRHPLSNYINRSLRDIKPALNAKSLKQNPEQVAITIKENNGCKSKITANHSEKSLSFAAKELQRRTKICKKLCCAIL